VAVEVPSQLWYPFVQEFADHVYLNL